MTLWQIVACVDGYIAANSVDVKPEPMSHSRFDEMLREREERLSRLH